MLKRCVNSDLVKNLNDLSYNQVIYTFDTLSRSGINDWHLWDHLCERVKPELKLFNIYDNLKIVHSLAKVSYRKLSLLSTIDRLVLKTFKIIDPRHLTQYLIDLNKLDNLEANTFITIVNSSNISLFSSFDLCFLLHLASKLQLQDFEILDKISNEILNNDDKFQQLCLDKISVAIVIRSLGFLQYKNRLFSTLISEILPSLLYKFNNQELTNILMSIIIAYLHSNLSSVEGITSILLDRIAYLLPQLTFIEVNQLFISLYYLKHNFSGFNARHEELLNSIVKLNMKFVPSTSKLQMKLSSILDELKVEYKTEYIIGPYRVDYVIPAMNVSRSSMSLEETRTAIEVNGYTHFYHKSINLNGITQLKYKIIEDLGWRVIGIDYYDWKNKNRQDKLEYLLEKLKKK